MRARLLPSRVEGAQFRTKLELVTVRFVLLALGVALAATRRIYMAVAAGLAFLLRIGGQRRR